VTVTDSIVKYTIIKSTNSYLGEWLASHSGCFSHGKSAPTYLVGGSARPGASLIIMEKRKIVAPAKN
jgi:hypothetical protein